jgi:hypothetical protein
MPRAETLRRVDKSSASHENGSLPRMSSLQLVNGKRNVKAKSQRSFRPVQLLLWAGTAQSV